MNTKRKDIILGGERMENVNANINVLEKENAVETLKEGQKQFLDTITTYISGWGETMGLVVKKKHIAQEMDCDIRSVTRYMNTLEDRGIIETSARRGRNGGTVITFDKELIKDIKSHPDNPITGETKRARELREMYYPNKGTYKPDNRTPEEKARDKALKKWKNDKNEQLNDQLEPFMIPTREVFLATENPDLYYRAYLMSRMYNAMLVLFPEQWKNQAEAIGDEVGFKKAKRMKEKYQNFDVMDKRFFGTSTYRDFTKLAYVLHDSDISPLEYLGSQFEYMDYLAKQGRSAKRPYTNALIGVKAWERFYESANWKENFDKKHPYYKKPGDVRVKLKSYPITTLLEAEFDLGINKQPTSSKEYNDFVRNPLPVSKRQIVTYQYLDSLRDEVENNTQLTEEERDSLSKFTEQQVSRYMSDDLPQHQKLRLFPSEIEFKGLEKETHTNLRNYYAELGNLTNKPALTALDNAKFVKKGYQLDLSLRGNYTFPATLKAIRNVRESLYNPRALHSAIDKIDVNVPINKHSMLAMDEIYKQHKVDETDDRSKINKDYIEDGKEIMAKNIVENKITMWYDEMESKIGDSKRDGTEIIPS